MRLRLKLSGEERRTLREMGIYHPHARTRMRAQGMYRLAQGLTLQQVADEFEVHLVVGETTGGGANQGDDKRLLPNFSLFVPLGRIISPVTKTNWEGVGVTPDLSVCARDASRTAQVAILTRMAASGNNPDERARLHERIAELGTGATSNISCS